MKLELGYPSDSFASFSPSIIFTFDQSTVTICQFYIFLCRPQKSAKYMWGVFEPGSGRPPILINMDQDDIS